MPSTSPRSAPVRDAAMPVAPSSVRIILWMLIAAVLFFGLAFFGVMVSWHLLMPMSPQDVETKKLADVVLQLVHDERLGAAKEGRTVRCRAMRCFLPCMW